MTEDALAAEFMGLYTAWGDAIAEKRHDWLEDFFTDDFLGTAQPWPTLRVDKQQMIDLDKSIKSMETQWVSVEARRIGDEVLTIGRVRYLREEFEDGAVIGEGMPSGSQIAELTKGKLAIYMNGWRHNGDRWQCYDHHLVAVIPDDNLNQL